MQFETEPNHVIVKLTSENLFYEMFTNKTFKKSDLRIPTTILANDGDIQSWLFNSEKQRNHPVLKKKHQNISSLKLVRSLCHIFCCTDLLQDSETVEDISEKMDKLIKQNKYTTLPQYVSILYKSMKDNKSMKFTDFVKTLSNRSYIGAKCPEGWKLVQDKSYLNSKTEDLYYVEATRPSDLLNLRFSFLRRTTLLQQQEQRTSIDQQKIFKIFQGQKSISKVYDQSLCHRLLTTVSKTIEFLENCFKLSVKYIVIKCVLNKNREPIFLGILNLLIKIPDRYFYSDQIKKRQVLPFKYYIKLNQKLKSLPQVRQKRRITTEGSVTDIPIFVSPVKEFPCQGDLCKLPLKNEGQKKLLQPSLTSNEIPKDIIKKTRKNMPKILEKLKQANIISSNPPNETYHVTRKQTEQSYDDEDEEVQQHSPINKNSRVCRRCYYLYSNIIKLVQFDSRGNIINTGNQNKHLANLFADLPKKIDLLNIRKESQTNRMLQKKNSVNRNIQKVKNVVFADQPKMKLERMHSVKKQIKAVPPIISNSATRKASSFQNKARGQSLTNLPKINLFKGNSNKQPAGILNKKVLQTKPIKQIKKQYDPEAAKNILMMNVTAILADSIPDMKLKLYQNSEIVKRKNEGKQYLATLIDQPSNWRQIYQYQNNSPMIVNDSKLNIKDYPTMTLAQLSEITGYPEIIMKNNFMVDTLVIDSKTTLVYCVLTCEMFDNANKADLVTENLLIFHDMFDCFLEYLQISKELLEKMSNKRIILFNIPGQSHTIFDKNEIQDHVKVNSFVDKLLFRLNHLNIINFQQDSFKYAGVGYGGYLLQYYLISNFKYYHSKSVLFVNPILNFEKTQIDALEKMQSEYSNRQSEKAPYILYNNLINGSNTPYEDIETSLLLNPISVEGRQHLIKSILNSKTKITDRYDEVTLPTTVLLGEDNKFVKVQEVEHILFDSNQQFKQHPNRQILLLQNCGHNIKHDRMDQLVGQLERLLEN